MAHNCRRDQRDARRLAGNARGLGGRRARRRPARSGAGSQGRREQGSRRMTDPHAPLATPASERRPPATPEEQRAALIRLLVIVGAGMAAAVVTGVTKVVLV